MRISVVITGVGGGGVGEQVMKSLRLCGDRYRLIGTDMTRFSIGLYRADTMYLLPPAGSERYIDELLDVCHREKAQVLVPGSEPELRAISKDKYRFTREGILLLVNRQSVVDLCMDKWKTHRWLVNHGFKSPETRLTTDAGFLHLKPPVIVKPAIGGGGSFNCYMAQSTEESIFFADYIKKQGIQPIVQRYMGDAGNEYTVGVLTDLINGELLGSIALRREITSGLSNRMRITDRHGGNTLVVSSGISQGEFRDYPHIRRACEQVALALGSKGPLNVQCRVLTGNKLHDTEVYIFEINPRLSGTTYLRALAGRNDPDALIRRHLLGDRSPLPEYTEGLALRGLSEEVVQ
jgi:carbamoyl-phosphate synthase large subunit